MHELKFEDKVRVWKELRQDLESAYEPFRVLNDFIQSLPRSNRKQNPWDPESVALPWHLIENKSFTEYEIALLCAYTLQLTDRFCNDTFEIHICTNTEKSESIYLLYINDDILNYENNTVINSGQISSDLIIEKKYTLPCM